MPYMDGVWDKRTQAEVDEIRAWDRSTHGRCDVCEVIYCWPKGAGSLKGAVCPVHGLTLRQTTLVSRLKRVYVDRVPHEKKL